MKKTNNYDYPTIEVKLFGFIVCFLLGGAVGALFGLWLFALTV